MSYAFKISVHASLSEQFRGRGMKKIFLLRKSLLAGILEEEARENSYNLNFVIDR